MKRILIVEDNEANRELLIQLLDEEFALETAVNGQEALDKAAASLPDLILLDLSLPIVNGWAVARRLKSSDSTRAIPVVALTAHAMAGDREKALQSGCDEYIAKPFEEEHLFSVIRTLLGESV